MKKTEHPAWRGRRPRAFRRSAALADTTLKMVEVITSPPRTEFLKKQIAEFEAANPGIKVELVSLPWGQAFEKFLTMVQAGDTPDIVEMPERWMGLYANNGQLEDLGPYMANWADAATLGERAKQFGSTVDDKQYMIPYGYYIHAMFWNKKLFKEAGLDRRADDARRVRGSQQEDLRHPRQIRLLPARRARRLQRHAHVHEHRQRQGRLFQRGRHLDHQRGRLGQGPADAGRHLQERLGAEGQRELGLQRDRHRLLFRHLRHARPGSGRADRHRREDERRTTSPWRRCRSGRTANPIRRSAMPAGRCSPTPRPRRTAWKLMAILLVARKRISNGRRSSACCRSTMAPSRTPHFKTEQFKGWFEELNNPRQVRVRDAADPSGKSRQLLSTRSRSRTSRKCCSASARPRRSPTNGRHS